MSFYTFQIVWVITKVTPYMDSEQLHPLIFTKACFGIVMLLKNKCLTLWELKLAGHTTKQSIWKKGEKC